MQTHKKNQGLEIIENYEPEANYFCSWIFVSFMTSILRTGQKTATKLNNYCTYIHDYHGFTHQ